jgi:hypothetical protein
MLPGRSRDSLRYLWERPEKKNQVLFKKNAGGEKTGHMTIHDNPARSY